MVCFCKAKKVLGCSGLPRSQKGCCEHPPENHSQWWGKDSLCAALRRLVVFLWAERWCPPLCSVILCYTPGANISNKVSFQTETQMEILCKITWMVVSLNQSIIPRFPFKILMEECLIFNIKPSYKSCCYKTNSSSGLAQSYTESLSDSFTSKSITLWKQPFKIAYISSCWHTLKHVPFL